MPPRRKYSDKIEDQDTSGFAALGNLAGAALSGYGGTMPNPGFLSGEASDVPYNYKGDPTSALSNPYVYTGNAFGRFMGGGRFADELNRGQFDAQLDSARRLEEAKKILDMQKAAELGFQQDKNTMSSIEAAKAKQNQVYDLAAALQAGNEPALDYRGEVLPFTDPAAIAKARLAMTNLGPDIAQRGLTSALAGGEAANLSREKSALERSYLGGAGRSMFERGLGGTYEAPAVGNDLARAKMQDLEQQQIFEAARIKSALDAAKFNQGRSIDEFAFRNREADRENALRQRVDRPTFDPQTGRSFLPPESKSFETINPRTFEKGLEFKTFPGGEFNKSGQRVIERGAFNPSELSTGRISSALSSVNPNESVLTRGGFSPYGRVGFSPASQAATPQTQPQNQPQAQPAWNDWNPEATAITQNPQFGAEQQNSALIQLFKLRKELERQKNLRLYDPMRGANPFERF